MQAMPRLVVPVIVLVLFLVGAFAPPVYAAPALLVLIVFVGWLASFSWPDLDTPARLVRLFVVGIVIALLASRVAEAVG